MSPNAWMIVLDLAALGVLIVVLTWIKRETIAGYRHGGTSPPLDTREPRADLGDEWAPPWPHDEERPVMPPLASFYPQRTPLAPDGKPWGDWRSAYEIGEPEPLVLEPRRELGPGE